ncbi:AmmeMemoRadiSam system radical SAM enzyme, partial [Candidatus Bathyarchaeota archaeon]
GHPGENTYCPECGALLIERYGFSILDYCITEEGRCPECGHPIPIVGKAIL